MRRRFRDPALYLSFALGLTPLIFSAFCYDELPMLLPTHWGFGNQADRYSSSFFAAVVIPAVLLALSVLVVLAINGDITRKQGFGTHCLKFLLPCVSIFVYLTLVARIVWSVSFLSCIPIAVGTLLVILAAWLPSCRRDTGHGILLPWTVQSENNWRFTHRAACVPVALSGFLLMAAAFVQTLPLICVAAALCLLSPFVLSFGYSHTRKR